MLFRYVVNGLLVAIIIACLPIMAQEKAADKIRNEFISLDVYEQPFSDIIDGIREQTGKNIIYDDQIKTIPVTIRLIQVHWRKVLDVIAKEKNCLIEELDLKVIKVSKPPTVNMEFDGADIRDVIDQIAAIANKNIVISEQVKGAVTLRLQDVPWLDALKAIIKNGGYILVQEAEGKILRVVPPEEIQAQLETEIFKLRYVRPKSRYVAKMSSEFFTEQELNLASGAGAGAGAVQLSAFSLLNALNAVITPGKGQITYDDGTNTLVITDVKPKLDKMEEIIKQLDIEPKQIFIDVKFIRTTNTDVFNFGLGFGQTGIQINHSFGQMFSRLPFTLGNGGFEDEIAFANKAEIAEGIPTDNNVDIITEGRTVEPGILSFLQTTFVVELLKTDNKTKLIQAPKIITLDHHEATIFVGNTIAFAVTEIVQNDNGTTSVQLVEADDSPVRTGFQILIVPHVIPDTNKVQLTVIPSNDALVGDSDPNLQGFNLFQSGGATISLPELQTQTIVTHMILESGQTAVVGGLLFINQQEVVSKVPFFGDLPLLGYLFKSKQIAKNKEDLFIFITPRIVRSAEDTAERLKATMNEHRKTQEGKYSQLWGGNNNAGSNADKK